MHRFICACFVALFGLVHCGQSKYVISNEQVTFFQAFERCKQHNMDPVEVLSEAEESNLEAVLPTITSGYEYGYWLFATNLGDYQNFVWLNSGKSILYSKYNEHEPNNPKEENCLQLLNVGTNKNYRWNDVSCNKKLEFICQKRQEDYQAIFGRQAILDVRSKF